MDPVRIKAGLISRRDVIRVLGAGVIAGVPAVAFGKESLAGENENNSDAIYSESSPGFAATVISADTLQLTVLAKYGSVVVRPGEGSRMYSGVAGRVASPMDFIPGDRVIVQGASWANSTVMAKRVGSIFTPTQLTVLSVDKSGGFADTSIGRLDLNGVLPDVSRVRRSLEPGDTVSGLTWTDPRSRQIYLVLTERDRLS